MNSLRTLQALNQVVNHDICPQMKALIAENKRLVAKNNRCLKKIKSAGKSLRDVLEMNKILRAENTELSDWKDYMLHMDYFKCVDCENIRQEEDGDVLDDDGEHFRCEDCVNLMEDQARTALHYGFSSVNPPNLVGYDVSPTTMIELFANEPDIDMETDPRFEYDEEEDGYIFRSV